MIRKALAAVVAHPSLAPEALRQLLAVAPRGWWRRPPFLPRPAEGWMAFRAETLGGSPLAQPTAGEFADFLVWSRAQRRSRG